MAKQTKEAAAEAPEVLGYVTVHELIYRGKDKKQAKIAPGTELTKEQIEDLGVSEVERLVKTKSVRVKTAKKPRASKDSVPSGDDGALG